MKREALILLFAATLIAGGAQGDTIPSAEVLALDIARLHAAATGSS